MESALAPDAGGAERYASQPAHQAQDLIYDAWEATGARRVTFARQALALWPDCADAYVLLAQQTASLGEARGLLVQCDGLMMDPYSRSDTWPDIQIQNPHATLSVSVPGHMS